MRKSSIPEASIRQNSMKTVSLELSKQLKEAGYPQNMDWIYSWYCSESDCEERELQTRDDNYCESCGRVVEVILSPTADEILEQLPARLKDGDELEMIKYPEKYVVGYWHEADQWSMAEEDISLADSAAKMWLYLKKEGLL